MTITILMRGQWKASGSANNYINDTTQTIGKSY